jgi:hypothetical protein
MIGNLLRLITAAFAYFCMATLIAQAGMLSWLWSKGLLDRERVAQVATLVRDGELPSAARPKAASQAASETVTLADVEAARSVRLRQFELREQATHNVLKQVRFETEQLSKEKERFDRVYESFEKQLGKDRVTAITQGNENARLLLESIKPKQSKELIMEMLKADEIDEVVILFGAMPIAKRAKIAAEFKSEEETGKLDEIVRRIRQGLPDTAIIDQTRQTLAAPTTEP